MSNDVTRRLAQFVADSRWCDIPSDVRHEAKRALLNWLGCAIGGCRDDSVERLVAALAPFSGERHATLLGRGGRVDALTAACINGTGSNRLDFDDTHLRTVIHPTVPVASALLALAEHRPIGGAAFLHAFVLGVDAECRVGNAISPEHYAHGWQITATCGVLGTALASGKMLGLDQQRLAWALGIAATHASGLMEMLGTMCKSYNMGHAARNGLQSALLAERGFTSAERALEGKCGFLNVLALRRDVDAITHDLGARWELMANAYKPYPCGIVNHPVLDACIDLRVAHRFDPSRIARIEVDVNPLAATLCGIAAPRDSLEGKLSLYHSAAVALIDGEAGVAQYLDARVQAADVVALRDRVHVTTNEAVGKAQARVRVVLADGSTCEQFVDHARGSLERPLTDAELEAKFRRLAATELAPETVDRLVEQCWTLENLADASVLARDSAAKA